MKILHIAECFAGGVYSFLVDLTEKTCDKYEIIIAHGVRENTPVDYKTHFNDKVRFVEVKNFTREINLKKDFYALKEIKEIIKREKPDIIHLHSSKAGILGRLANKKIKMFYSPHGFSFLKQDDSRFKRFIYRFIEKMATFRKCTIVACSQGEYEEAKKLTKSAVKIDNGIDISSPFPKKDTPKELSICTSGRISFQKNPKLFNEIASAFPNINFTWIGDGELREELTASNITITGWKSRNDVLEEVNRHSCFLLTSLWEGLPLSLLEAMYMERVCVVSDCIGNRDVIKNGINGFICNNLEEYRNVINALLEDDFPYIRKTAKNDIIGHYNTDRMAKEFMELWE